MKTLYQKMSFLLESITRQTKMYAFILVISNLCFSTQYAKAVNFLDTTISSKTTDFSSNEVAIISQKLDSAIQNAEKYLNNNMYKNPSYIVLFAKYFQVKKNLINVNIKEEVVHELIKSKDVNLLQKLYNPTFIYNKLYVQDVIANMLKIEKDSIGTLVLIALHSKQLNKDKYNKLFKLLAKDIQNKYKQTHLYYAIKSIEKMNIDFLSQESILIAQNIEDVYLPLYMEDKYNEDLYFETLAFLTEFKNPILVLDEFHSVIAKQNDDGGFSTEESTQDSCLHPTLLALWYMLNIKNYI